MALIGISKKKDKRKIQQQQQQQVDKLVFDPQVLGLSAAAAHKIIEKSNLEGFKNNTLRIKIQGGGCSGLQYIFSFDDQQADEKDLVTEKDAARVVVDYKSFKVLQGCVLDWQESLGLSSFVVRNPHAKNACSCGASFTL